MKNIKILLLAVLSLTIAACNNDKHEDIAGTIEILGVDSEFSAAGGEGRVRVSATGENVSAESNVEWLTIQNSSSLPVRFTLTENRSLSNRVATITLKNSTTSREVLVYQQGTIMNVPNTVVMPIKRSSTQLQYTINLNVTPSVVVTEGSEWFSATSNDNIITIQTKSDNIIERTGRIKIMTEWSTLYITVIQQGIIDKTSIFLFNGELFANDAIELNSEVVKDLTVEKQETWYSATIVGNNLEIKKTGENSGSEARVSNLTLRYGDVSAMITVAQSNKTYYDYLRGTWSMSYNTGGIQKDVEIKFSEKVADQLILAIKYSDILMWNSALSYDEATGKLSLSPHVVGSFGSSSTDLIYVALYSASTGRAQKKDDISVDFIFNRDYSNPQLIFKDNGSWGTQIADGLLFAIYSVDGSYKEAVDLYPFITTFTKR